MDVRQTSGEWEFFYSGGERHERGVGVLMKKRLGNLVKGFWPVSERVIMIKIESKPVSLNIIQVYAPTADQEEEVIEEFYEQMDRARRKCKPGEVTVVMDDLNAKIGRGRSGNIVGDFGLGERNERGDRLVEWCSGWDQVVLNTFFRHPPRHLYTWKSPGDRYRNQIDFITINQRFRNSVTQTRTYPGADCGVGCDHQLLVTTVRLKLKKTKQKHVEGRKRIGVPYGVIVT